MAQSVSMTWDWHDLQRLTGHGIEKAVTRAVIKAGRDGLRALKSASARSVRFRKRIRVSRINASLPTQGPRSHDLADLEWRMDVSGKAIPVIDYASPRQTLRGVSVGINGGRRVLIKSAFIATMRSGHTGVFMRSGKANLPIRELYTTRVSDVFEDNGMVPAILARAKTEFTKTFERVLPLEIERLK